MTVVYVVEAITTARVVDSSMTSTWIGADYDSGRRQVAVTLAVPVTSQSRAFGGLQCVSSLNFDKSSSFFFCLTRRYGHYQVSK